MAEYVRVGAPTNASERAGIRRLRDQLPDHYIVIGNFELQPSQRKNTLEYDAVVIGEWGLYAVEIKGWGGTIRGDMARWTLEWGRVENPFIRIETKAKALRDILVRNVDQFPDDLFCQSVVFLPRDDVRFDIDDPRSDRLIVHDGVWDFFVGRHVEEGPGVLQDDEIRQAIREAIVPRAEPGPKAPNVPNYIVEERIDSGDGEKYREYIGRHEVLRSRDKVRIKEYALDPLLPREEREARFSEAVRDLEALSQLDDNDYIVRAYDVFRDQDDELLFYLVSEWVGPKTLHHLFGTGELEASVPPETTRAELARHVVRAVRDVHREGIVHRNLNPSVFYLVDSDAPGAPDVPLQLADFDYARMTQLRSIAGELSTIGTQGYTAPEIWNREEHDHRADIYSVGTILYELFVGETLYSGMSEVLDHEGIWAERRSKVENSVLRELLDEMLVGNPEERLDDIGTAVDVVDEVADEVAG